jgi:7 transmembrane sweet-taste receptor of 3 GCPR.
MADILKRAKPTLTSWNVNLDKVWYGDTNARNFLKKITEATDFNGISNRIHFDKNGNLYYDLFVHQSLDGNNFAEVGDYEIEHGVLRLRSVHWLGWRPHRDMVIKTTYKHLSSSIHLAIFILSIIGVVFAFALFVYVVVRRKRRYVKNTFWKINILILIGAILVYFSIIFFATEPESNLIGVATDEICLLRTVLFCIGASLVIGVLFAKLWTSFKVLQKNWIVLRKTIRKRMVVWFMIIVIVTSLLLALWCLLFSFKMTEKKIEKKEEILCSTIVRSFTFFVFNYLFL